MEKITKKVLIIENDVEIKEIVTYILESEGYDVSTSMYDNFIHESGSCDLVLLDEWVDKKEGYMLCKEIKSIHQLKHIPIIIFSTSFDIERIANSCKADGFLSKPFEVDTLVKVINNFF